MNQFFTLIVIFASQMTFSQNAERIEELVSKERKQVEKVERLTASTITYVPSIFAKEFVEQLKSDLNELTITKIYYVYTQYRMNPSFNQKELDRDRFEKLDRIIDKVTINPFIEWELLEQTGCTDYKDGHDYFHGFILIHRPIMTEEERMDEVNSIINFFENPEDLFVVRDLDLVKKQLNDSICPCEFDKLNEKKEGISLKAEFKEGEYALFEYLQKNLKNKEEVILKRDDIWVDTKFKVDEYGRISQIEFSQNYPKYLQDEVTMAIIKMPDWYPAVEENKPVESIVNLQIRVSYSGSVKGMYKRDFLRPTFQADEVPIKVKEESTALNLMIDRETIALKVTAVYKGLDQVPSDEKIALVMDVTGSMSMNIAAMKKWITVNIQHMPFSSFTFFNDGDGKATNKKKIGKTGGIYYTQFEKDIKDKMKRAMLNGGGGERPENDIEAILYALDNDKACDAVLLIGDNYSEVRDLSLLPRVDKKVYVLPCSAPKAIRDDYLNIARQTGGHLIINGAIQKVDHVQKGDKFFIRGTEYKFDGKKFQLKK